MRQEDVERMLSHLIMHREKEDPLIDIGVYENKFFLLEFF